MINKHLEKLLNEFDEKFEVVIIKDIQIPSDEYLDALKQFISKSFEQYAKAYIEDILPKEIKDDELDALQLGYNQALADIKSNLQHGET